MNAIIIMFINFGFFLSNKNEQNNMEMVSVQMRVR